MADESIDPLVRAIELCREFESSGADCDIETFLAENEGVRELLEPLVRKNRTPDDRQLVGDYELVRELGRGGMGVVYEAIQIRLGRRVALKLLPACRSLSARALAMFRREATLAGSLDHPGIVRVLDLQERDGQLALAMELVDGTPLDEVLDALRQRDPRTLRVSDLTDVAGVGAEATWTGSYESTVVDLMRQVAEALDHAHSRGVVHRDVKPSNILLTSEGKAVLTDFGLAREEGGAGVTRTGEFAGTYRYAAPEQLAGRRNEIDGRTDLYALGVTLYELLTLARPLDADSLSEFFEVMRNEVPPPPTRRNPRIARDLDAVVMCALEKEPRHRYASAAELAADLACVLEGRPVRARRIAVPARSARWIRRNKMASALVAVLIVSTVVVAGLAWSANRSEGRSQESLRRFDNLWVGAALDGLVSRSSDAHPARPEKTDELRALVSTAVELLDMQAEHERVLGELRKGGVVAKEPSKREAHRIDHLAEDRKKKLEGEIQRIEGDQTRPGASPAVLERANREVATIRDEVAALAEILRQSDRVRIENRRDADLHDRLENQLFRLRDLKRVLLPDLQFRLAWSEKIRRLSVEEERDAWQALRRRLEKRKDFEPISPQVGLVPLGEDPGSELEEFVHLMSGEKPKRVDGKLQLGTEHGIVFVLVKGGIVGAKKLQLDPFFIAKHEVSRAQWERLARGLPGLRWRDGGYADLRNLSQLDKPVNGVSWHMSERLLRRAGLELPTAVQWAYAAYIGNKVPRTLNDLARQANLCDRSYRRKHGGRVLNFDDGYAGLAPVVSMDANPAGLLHMYGNVSEWCRDSYLALASGADPRKGDGLREANVEDGAPRLKCGGHWQGDKVLQLQDRRSAWMSARDTGVRPVRKVLP